MKLKKRAKWILLSVIVIAVAAAGAFLLLPGKSAPKPNVVIVLIDTLRADHTGLYGYERNTTPNLNRIAKKGLKLENFFVNSPWTKPSVASFITGLYPTQHGSRVGQFENMGIYVLGTPKVEILNSKTKTMAEIMKKAGFSTHAFVSNYHMTPKFGYHQGYDFYFFNPHGAGKKVVCDTDKDAVYKTMKVLENRGEKPVFVWCHLMAVHGYRYPPGFEKFKPAASAPLTPLPAAALQQRGETIEDFDTIEEAVCSYDNSIYYTDSLIGELFDFITAKTPDTILIVASDHGEEFYEHGGFAHSMTLYNEILKVPCVIYGPGVPVGVFSGLSDSIDLLPTLMKNLDIKVSGDLQGRALFFKNRLAPAGEKEIFAEQHHRGLYKRFALIRDNKKMIVSRHKTADETFIEFFRDGLSIEKENVLESAGKAELDFFERRITFFKVANETYFKKKVGRPTYKDLSPEDIEHLRSLGYIE